MRRGRRWGRQPKYIIPQSIHGTVMVGEVTEDLGMSRSGAWRHMERLRDAGHIERAGKLGRCVLWRTTSLGLSYRDRLEDRFRGLVSGQRT